MFNFDNDPRMKELAKEKAELNARLAEIARQESRIIYELTTTPEQRAHQQREAEKERQRQIDISLGQDPISLHMEAAREEAAAARAAELERARLNNERIKRQQEEYADHIRRISPR